ncbi:MAG: ubiquinol-cytochrome c reductase iron-sulfur subunit [Proteobacteria bacterium]|nr:ubiquinol-cytochrome c reductase iron-sulfur subunit [Pseudomonadota bacterium]
MSRGVDLSRRHFLVVATTVTGTVGAVLATVPFISSWRPSARAQAVGAPVEIDISKIDPGSMVAIKWRGKAVWILHRTPQMIAALTKIEDELRDPFSNEPQQPAYAANQQRSIRSEFLVLEGVCTHLGCAPLEKFQPGDPEIGAGWQGGFVCPCHGSQFDLAGRVYKGVPAPTNLVVPPHRYIGDATILIGNDSGVAA